jgi:tripartite-type tricarboxylate transporter receptor subunit TctC
LKLRTGTDIVHVPYNGNAPSLAALIAGNAELGFAALPAVMPHVKAGRLRALASTGEKRSELLPDVPTMQEAGVSGVSVTTWYGVFAPAGTPSDIVDTLANAVIDAVQKSDFRQRLLDQGEEPVGSTPDAFGALVRDEIGKWTELARRAGIRAD